MYILGKGEQCHKPSYKIAFNVTECNRIHYQRFKIMDDMADHVKSASEAQSPSLETASSATATVPEGCEEQVNDQAHL